VSLLGVSLFIFGIGLFAVLVRRDIVAVLVGIEVMLAGALVLFVGLASSMRATGAVAALASAQATALVVLVILAAEASVGLALLVSVARRARTTRLDELTEVKG
jgi:NADH-quinone oxidoreductase subunit K